MFFREHLTVHHIAQAFIRWVIEEDEEFSADYQRYIVAMKILREELGDSVTDEIDAIEQQCVSDLLFSGFLGLKANLDNFKNPIARNFLDVDFEVYLREEVAHRLPKYEQAQKSREQFYFAIIGLFGEDADACAPNSGMILHDIAEKAQQAVDAATAECKELYGAEPIVVALSHTGTANGQGEDYELAAAVNGIDVIISGHTHTLLKEAIIVGDTYIVSAAEYGKYLGVVQLECNPDGTTVMKDYQLIPIDETVEEDAQIGALVEQFKSEVETNYLADYGMSFDQVLLTNEYEFDKVRDVYNYAHESTLCNVFSDAYKWAVEQTTGMHVDVALTASGVIRESIPMGEVTVSDIFNAASLGVGTEGELVQIYLTGADLMSALEVDASVYPLMHSAQLFYSGIEYSYNTNRMIFNKIDYAMLRNGDGTLSAIEDDTLYSVVCGMYMAQMLGSVESTSMGLVSIVPRDKDGNALTVPDLVDYVVRNDDGVPLKEWYAIASYLDQMENDVMDPQYGQVDGRKVVYSSLNPVKLLRNANKFTYILLAVLVVLLAVVLLIVRGVKRLVTRIKSQKHTSDQTF